MPETPRQNRRPAGARPAGRPDARQRAQRDEHARNHRIVARRAQRDRTAQAVARELARLGWPAQADPSQSAAAVLIWPHGAPRGTARFRAREEAPQGWRILPLGGKPGADPLAWARTTESPDSPDYPAGIARSIARRLT